MLGLLQIHRKGYTASMDNLPLTMSLQPRAVAMIEDALKAEPDVLAYFKRVKLGAMFSNFAENSSIRLNGVDAAVPTLLARGTKVKLGD